MNSLLRHGAFPHRRGQSNPEETGERESGRITRFWRLYLVNEWHFRAFRRGSLIKPTNAFDDITSRPQSWELHLRFIWLESELQTANKFEIKWNSIRVHYSFMKLRLIYSTKNMAFGGFRAEALRVICNYTLRPWVAWGCVFAGKYSKETMVIL